MALSRPRPSRRVPALESSPSVPHGGRQLMAVSVHEPEPLLAAPLSRLLQELRGEVLRVKGIVRLVDAPWTLTSPIKSPSPTLAALHLAGQQVELQPLSDPSAAVAAQTGSTLVFIGEELDETWLRLRLSACRSRPSNFPPTTHVAPSA